VEDFADQQELVERARTYRAMCDRSRRPARPKTFEELLNYGVVLHNRGEHELAVKYLRQALDIHPRNEGALYCLAAAQARAGDTPAALKALKLRSTPTRPAAPGARNADFEPLRAARVSGPGRLRLRSHAGDARSRSGRGRAREDPASTHVGEQVVVEAGAVLRPFTILEGRTTVRARAVVGPFVRLVDVEVGEGATVLDHCLLRESVIEAGASVGPFAHVRPDSRVGERAKVGNFVELKKTHLGEGSKAQHLSYLGDATVGPDVNIGAGTITCNYDGVKKSPTRIEAGAFVGSDSTLVAPVRG
jgi:acetyltransferase-like isoleucine patch superfamily enzyme